MDVSKTLSILATVASLLITGIGFPAQIYKNYKNKNTNGISYILFILSFLSYVLWSMRAYSVGDWYMFCAFVPGIFFSIIIFFQIRYYKYSKIMEMIDLSVRTGRDRDKLLTNPELKKFLKKIPIEKALYWAAKLDNEFETWKLVLSRKELTFKKALKCAEYYHHTIVWAIVLERDDIQKYFLSLSAPDAIAYAEKSERIAVWVFMLKRKDVQDLLMNRSYIELMNYVDKFKYIPELRSFVLSMSCPKSEGVFTDQQHM